MSEQTIEFFGMTMPVVKELGDGYVLALHKNGPCIVGHDQLCTLSSPMRVPAENHDSLFDDDEDDIAADVPLEIARLAVDAYVDWSWPKALTQEPR